MNNNDENEQTINIRLLNRDFQFKCENHDKEQLHEAANYLINCVQTIKQSGKVIDYERIIVMAALNICHERLVSQQNQQASMDKLQKRMQNLVNKLDAVEQEVKKAVESEIL